jgi:hypothetical protein
VFLLGVGTIAVGALALFVVRTRLPAFFRDGRRTVTDITVGDADAEASPGPGASHPR